MTFTPEEIAAMAKKAHGPITGQWWDMDAAALTRFAQLVADKAAARERQKRMEAELMAECMDMVRQELIDAGVIDQAVPPMMVANAVLRAINERVDREREGCAQVCELWNATPGQRLAVEIRARGVKEGA